MDFHQGYMKKAEVRNSLFKESNTIQYIFIPPIYIHLLYSRRATWPFFPYKCVMPVAYIRSRFFAAHNIAVSLTSMTDLTKLENHVSRDVYREFGDAEKKGKSTAHRPLALRREKAIYCTGFARKLKGLTRMAETLLLFIRTWTNETHTHSRRGLGIDQRPSTSMALISKCTRARLPL